MRQGFGEDGLFKTAKIASSNTFFNPFYLY